MEHTTRHVVASFLMLSLTCVCVLNAHSLASYDKDSSRLLRACFHDTFGTHRLPYVLFGSVLKYGNVVCIRDCFVVQ